MNKFIRGDQAPDYYLHAIDDLATELIKTHKEYLRNKELSLYMNSLAFSLAHLLTHILDNDNDIDIFLDQIKSFIDSIRNFSQGD